MKLYHGKWDPLALLAQYEQDRTVVVERHLRQPAENAQELAVLDGEIAKLKVFIEETL